MFITQPISELLEKRRLLLLNLITLMAMASLYMLLSACSWAKPETTAPGKTLPPGSTPIISKQANTKAEPMAQSQRTDLAGKVKALVASYPQLQVGLAIRCYSRGVNISIDGDTPYPLASVFKVPVMLELMRQIEQGELSYTLDSKIPLQNKHKCIGSGRLCQKPEGSPIAMRQAIELMITVSDNTATDLLFDLIGLDSVNRLCQQLNLKHTDIGLTNRTAWLLSLGQGKRFASMQPKAIAQYWKKLSAQQKNAIALELEEEFCDLSLAQFQKLEDASQSNSHWLDCFIASSMDNLSSPSDMAALLAALWDGKLLSPQASQYCLDVLARQHYNNRLPRLLPKNTRVCHKTGTLAGIINDAGIIILPDKTPLIVVVFIKNIGAQQEDKASDLIAKIGKLSYEACR